MKNSGKNISLTSYDEIFTPDTAPSGLPYGRIVEIPLEQLHPFKNHPFRVVDDEHMQKTAESIRDYGVLVPGLVRPRPEGDYEIISGHRRKRASEIAGKTTMPVIIRDLDDDEAIIHMVDSNLQRENILPSERAAAYQMKYDALKHQGKRTDLTSGQVVQKLGTSLEQIAEGAGENYKQIQRVMRLNHLVKPLLDQVDSKDVAFTPAVELSYLQPDEQAILVEAMASEQSTPSLSQAQRMKRLSQEGKLTRESIVNILSEVKKPPRSTEKPAVQPEYEVSPQAVGFITLPAEPFLKFIPRSLLQQQTPESREQLTRLFVKMATLYKKYIDKKRAQAR